MQELLPEAKAKLAPFVAEAKEHVKPLGHAAAYLAACLCWLGLLPLVMASALCQHVSAMFKPEIKKG
jgi:hypothetical protein